MTTKKVILLSAATHLSINISFWLIGWMIWPLLFIGLWLASGYFAYKLYKHYYPHSDDVFHMALIYGPLWLLFTLADNWKENIDYLRTKGFLPKVRNPFIWNKIDKDTFVLEKKSTSSNLT